LHVFISACLRIGGGTLPPQGGSVIPWASVLQINAAIHLMVNGENTKPLPDGSGSVCLIVEPGKQLSNHLEEDIQLLINFESNFKFKNKLD